MCNLLRTTPSLLLQLVQQIPAIDNIEKREIRSVGSAYTTPSRYLLEISMAELWSLFLTHPNTLPP